MSRSSNNTLPMVASSAANGPGSRTDARKAFEREMVAFFVDAAELLGVPKSVAAIYGVIFAAPEPIGFAEIEARLELSKGSVSQGLKALREMGAIRVCDADVKPETGNMKSEIGNLKTEVPSGIQVLSFRSQVSVLSSPRSSQVSGLNSGISSQVSGLKSQPSDRGAARRDLYEPDLEMRKLIQRFLQQRLEMQLETGKRRLAVLAESAAGFGTDERRVIEPRLKKLGRWHTRTRRLLPVIKTFLKI